MGQYTPQLFSEGRLLFGSACVPSGVYFTLAAAAAVVLGMQRYA